MSTFLLGGTTALVAQMAVFLGVAVIIVLQKRLSPARPHVGQPRGDE